MTKRSFILASVCFAGCTAGPVIAQRPNDPPDVATPSRGAPGTESPGAVDERVAEAFRAAIAVLNQLDGRDDTMMSPSEAEELERCAEIMRTREPENPWLHYLYGRIQALAGRQGAAIEHLRRFVATREGRNDWRARRVLGDLYVGPYPQLAKAEYEAANRLKENEPSVLYGLSVCAFKLGQVEEAVRLAQQVVTADRRPTARHLGNLAQVLRARRRWDESLRAAEQALQAARDTAGRREGERTPLQAIEAQFALLIDIRRARLAESSGTAADRLQLARDIRARAENATKLSLHDALDVLQEGVEETAPNTPVALRERYAVVLAETGRRDEAIAEFERLLAADPANAAAAEWLARLRPDPDP